MYTEDENFKRDMCIEGYDTISVTLWLASGALVFVLIVSIGATWVHHDHDLKECETRLYKHLTKKGVQNE